MIGILASKRNGVPLHWSVLKVYEEMKKRGIKVVVADIPETYVNLHELKYSFLKVPIDLCFYQKLTNGFASRMLLQVLEERGIPTVNNSESIEISSNKYKTYLLLRKNGFEIPKTFLATSYDSLLKIQKILDFPIVVKPVVGGRGIGLKKIDKTHELRNFENANYPLIVQEFVEKNRDLRVYVVGGKVVCGIARFGKSWIASISRGARIEGVEVPEETQELALKASRIVGLEIAAVDFLGDLINETNSVPGFKGVNKACNIKMEKIIVDYLVEKVKR